MRKPSEEFNYARGEKAYHILWKQTFDCLLSIDRIKSCYPNLVLMLCGNNRIIAFQYDCPVDLPWLKLKDKKWEKYDERSFSGAIWLNNILKHWNSKENLKDPVPSAQNSKLLISTPGNIIHYRNIS